MTQFTDQIRAGLEAREFSAYYQPKFDPDSEEVASLEALLRWRHPDLGFQGAGEFMPTVERSEELTYDVDLWVLNETTRQGRRWLDEDLPFGTLNVNISAWNASSLLVGMVETALKDSGFPAKLLALECPWRMLAADTGTIAGTMRDLRALGCSIVLDGNPLDQDCLDQVKQTPVQVSKVCIKHIQDLAESHGNPSVIGMVKAWQRNKVQIVSMGVENEDQAALSHQVGCRFTQGNRFKSPLPAGEVTSFLTMIEHTKQSLRLI